MVFHKAAIHWFRKGLRLHDNPSLMEALEQAEKIYPIFIIDPKFANPQIMSCNRYAFLLETLNDLDHSLRALGSRLFVARGKPEDQLPILIKTWGVSLLTFEADETGPYGKSRDYRVCGLLNCTISIHCTHTLFPMNRYVSALQGAASPKTYEGFLKLHRSLGEVRKPIPAPKISDFKGKLCDLDGAQVFMLNSENCSSEGTLDSGVELASYGSDETNSESENICSNKEVRKNGNFLDEIKNLDGKYGSNKNLREQRMEVPTLEDMGYNHEDHTSTFKGGETEALRRLYEQVILKSDRVAAFSKPETVPNPINGVPSTTVLSPYLTMGSLSVAHFFHEISKIYDSHKKHTLPPVSLHGQILFREYFYYCATVTPNFGTMEGNPECRQIPWNSDPILLSAWSEGKTGYPFIDAIMIQLKSEGWIHHLGRHAVACFLTRGDLWQSWVEGARVFERLLLDGDWALNNANWQWLSCSRFFYQYMRCYSPIAFGRKTDPTGAYIRRWIPALANFPDKYIYEPWLAPKSEQIKFGCIIGKDYPVPIVDHTTASKINMSRMAAAYSDHRDGGSKSLKRKSDSVSCNAEHHKKK